jgi:hypothetical protein
LACLVARQRRGHHAAADSIPATSGDRYLVVRTRPRAESLTGTNRRFGVGQSKSALPGYFVNLFRYGQRVIHFDPEIPDRAFDLGMPKQQLDGPKIARAPIDQGSFCASQ